MKADSIMGRRRLLHSIYRTIDDNFKAPKFDLDKETLRTNNFILSLNKLTTTFNSKEFLKKPLQEMLKEFEDPTMFEESSDDEIFPLLKEAKRNRSRSRSRKKHQHSENKVRLSKSHSRCKNFRNNFIANKGSQRRRKASEAPYKEGKKNSVLEVANFSPRKKSYQLPSEIKSKDELLININIKAHS